VVAVLLGLVGRELEGELGVMGCGPVGDEPVRVVPLLLAADQFRGVQLWQVLLHCRLLVRQVLHSRAFV
jgi:hypothetical protein